MAPPQKPAPDFIPADPDFIPAGTSPASPEEPDDRNRLQRAFDNVTTVTPEQEAQHGPIVNAMQKFGAGAIEGASQPFVHPLNTIEGLGKAVMHPIDTAEKIRDSAQADPARALGNLIGGAGLGMAAEGAVGKGVLAAGKMARTLAIGDSDAAALRGLQVGARSPKALSTLKSVEGARPYLAGAKDLEDFQGRIQPAKDEIFSEYKKAVEGIGDRPVNGPDGMTTVRDLEKERLQLSALNRGLKSGSPEALQLAQQKGMTAAQLLDRQKAVESALDPQLASTGIDPQGIRRAFGNVAQVGSRVSGKSTLLEKAQPTGLGKIRDVSFSKPLQAPGKLAGGLRDIVAGRPLFGAKPTDLGIREGFSQAGPKPDFGQFRMPMVKGLLQAPIEDIKLHDPFTEPVLPKVAFDAPVLGGKYPAGKAPANYFRYGDQPAEEIPGASGVNQQGVLRRRSQSSK